MLTDKDYKTIDVNKMYQAELKDCFGNIETEIVDGSFLMEEENSNYEVLNYHLLEGVN